MRKTLQQTELLLCIGKHEHRHIFHRRVAHTARLAKKIPGLQFKFLTTLRTAQYIQPRRFPFQLDLYRVIICR